MGCNLLDTKKNKDAKGALPIFGFLVSDRTENVAMARENPDRRGI